MTAGLYVEPPLQTDFIDGRRQAWRQAGVGDRMPLLLLHGIGSNSRAWAGQFAGFSHNRTVIAWNAPGYDHSDPLEQDWPSPDDYARSALSLLNHLRIGRCVVVGQSLGAVMAVALVRRAPERVAALALASPAAGYGTPRFAALPAKIRQRIDDLADLGPHAFAERRSPALLSAAASAAARAIVRDAMSEVTPVGYLHAARLLASANLASDVAELSLPRTVLWGGADVITPPDSCRQIAAAAACAGIEIQGVGHGFATEAPARFNAVIQSLLDSVETWS